MPSRLGGKPPRVTNASKLVDAKPKCSSYGKMLLLAHKVTLELTFSTQHKDYGLNPLISQREGWGEPLRLRACLKWLRTSTISPETTTFH
jgi:hypothetical protein